MTPAQQPVATPCRTCNDPIVLRSVADGEGARIVAMDPATTVYVRESDGEGGGVWARVRAGEVAIMAAHRCRGRG